MYKVRYSPFHCWQCIVLLAHPIFIPLLTVSCTFIVQFDIPSFSFIIVVKSLFDFVCIVSTCLTFCPCHNHNVMLWELILVIFELMTDWHIINLNIHIFKIWVRYTSFASCSTLSYSFNQKVQWCLRKIGYVQCTAGIWCWIFDGQWMSRIYQYKNWLIHMIWQWRPLTIVFWFNLNLKYQRTMCSFTHFSSPKLKFHNFKKKVKDSWNHDESNCGEGYHHNEVIM